MTNDTKAFTNMTDKSDVRKQIEAAIKAGRAALTEQVGMNWICLNQMTADLLEAYKAGHFQPKK